MLVHDSISTVGRNPQLRGCGVFGRAQRDFNSLTPEEWSVL